MQSGMRNHGVRSLQIGLVVGALVAAVAGLETVSYAQGVAQARVNVEFPFVAGDKDLAAGPYEFSAEPGRIVLRAMKDRKTPVVTMNVITRLGGHNGDANAELIFDKIDGKSVLSEVWFPRSDGYLVAHSTGDHKHQVVGGSGGLRAAKR